MKDEEYYKKYPHIVPGSIEEVPSGTEISIGRHARITSHGKICVIRCIDYDKNKDCLKTRIINIQDAGQVKRCSSCTRHDRNIRRRRKRQ